ncbi:hypothetical protein LPJ63_002234 [Coemansia sp. RSA 2711]|nr:hypothetical protein LPJ63_002234 [Coemansia sp. RSA 2711]
MAAGNAKTKAKVAALKKKLRTQGKASTKKSHSKKPETLADRQQRAKSLAKAFAVPPTLTITASTKHSAGRRDMCQSLDRSAADTGMSESLRSIGAAEIPTIDQLAQKAAEERERMARAYEYERVTMDQNVDELANLMAGPS